MSNVTLYKLSLLDSISAPMRKVTGASTEVIDKLDALSAAQKKCEGVNESLGGSIASLRAKMDMLRQERELISPANIEDVRTYNKEILALEKQIEKLDNLGNVDPLKNLNASAIIDLTQSTADAISNLSQGGIGFDQSVADLSAITGIAGADLDRLSSAAKKVGADSGLGAANAVEAFKLLASQIDVSKIGLDGLEELQKRTITLSQAGGLSMAESAEAMAGTINQFGLEASEANRVINVLAAGSKYGAAEIPELAQSFKVVGAAASAAGLNVESTAGAIEVLSKNNLKGAEAGTALRNIVLKMQTALGYDFTKTSLSDALEDLKPKMHDAAYMSKLFGMENIAAAQFLVANADAVSEMTSRVTDSNVAQEQAAIRTNTVQAMMDRCKAKVDNLKIGFFDLMGPSAGYATILSDQAVVVSQLIPLFSGMRRVISWISSAEKVRTLATGASTVATNIMTGATWLFNAALSASPIFWVVSAVAALITTVSICWRKFEGFRVAVFGVWGVVKEFGISLLDSVVTPFKQVLNGIGGVCSAIVSLVKGNFEEAAAEAKSGFKDIGSATVQMTPAGLLFNTIKGGDYKGAWAEGAQRGHDSWADSQLKSGEDISPASSISSSNPLPDDLIPAIEPDHTPIVNMPVKAPLLADNNIDLGGDKPQSLIESSAYSTITRKLRSKSTSVLPKVAASIAFPLAVAASPSDAYTLPGESKGQFLETNTISNDSGKRITVDKVCDQIVIYIQNTDGKGTDTIKEEIIKVLEELGDE